MLLRRGLRDARSLDLDPAAVVRDVDAVLRKLTAAGLIDDGNFAATRARRLAQAGRSPRRIAMALAQKGLDEAVIAMAMQEVREELPDPERAAAIAYARRRKLGPWAPAEARATRREKDLAIMGRAGFGFGTARAVIDAEAT